MGVEAEADRALGRTCPVTGATVQPPGPDSERLARQAYDLVTALLARHHVRDDGRETGSGGATSRDAPEAVRLGNEIHQLGRLVDPVISASVPVPPPDMDWLRRHAHEFIESLLVTFSQATGEKAAPYEDQVPLIRCAAPVRAGDEGSAAMVLANEEGSPSDVSLYCTDFVGDSGYEIPSLCVTISPRATSVPPGAQATFSIKIAVPQQTPAGTYSGLIQATGSKYVKAVLSLQVL